jgi:hypothetical protein
MILFFNPTITQTVGPTGMNMTVGAEYAINQLKELYDFNKIFRSDLNFRYYIENQFPQWIQDQAKKDSDVKIIDLIQEFYNFYFSSNGLNLYPNYEYIQSVFFSNQDGLRALYSSLFSDFDFDDFISSKEEELRTFLISNKSRFIANKGTRASYDYFLDTLFADVEYQLSKGIDETFVLNTSDLNDKTLTDGTDYQEYSIRIEASIDEKYQDDFIALLKPVGFYMNLVDSPQVFAPAISAINKNKPLTLSVS